MAEELSAEVVKIREERAARAALKAAGQWPPAEPKSAPRPKRKKPASKKKVFKRR